MKTVRIRCRSFFGDGRARDPRHPLRIKARTKASWFVVQYRGGKDRRGNRAGTARS